MAADNSPVAKVEAPALKALSIQNKLAPSPKGAPKHAVSVKNAAGQAVTLADPRATRALVACMDVHAVVGGAACHWGGPAALAEVMSALHGIMFSVQGREWYEAYNFVNDAGHTENGVYALRALYGFDGLDYKALSGFRSIASKLTGHGESHLNPEGVYLSNGPLGSSIPQAQGLAMGDKLIGNDRTTLCVISDGAAMEGEAKEAFAAIPGLAGKGQLNPFVMILSDNDTKLSGRITKDSFSMLPTLEALAPLGWNVIKVENGNDLQATYLAVEKAIAAAKADPKKPVAIWLKTVKGFGIKKTEVDSSGGHGFPLKDGESILEWMTEIFTGSEVPSDILAWAKDIRASWEKKQEAAKNAAPKPAGAKTAKIQAGLSAGAIKAAQEGLPVVTVSADLAGSTGMSTFAKSFPERAFDIGIAESNMVSAAAGLSKQGFIPIVDTFAQFGVTKGKLPLTMAVLSQAPVIAVFSHCGFQDAADGASHQATTYFAAVSAIPHTTVISCSCSDEAESYMLQAIRLAAEARKTGHESDNVIFFVGRENYPLSWQPGVSYNWGKAQVLREGKDVTFLTNGPLVGKALAAADQLAAAGKSATVINNAFVNKIDVATIGAAVKATGGKLVTLEDHQVIGGAGAQVVHALVNAGIEIKARSLGIKGEFGQSAYTADELYNKHGLNAAGLLAAAKELGV
jgi:transketolase